MASLLVERRRISTTSLHDNEQRPGLAFGLAAHNSWRKLAGHNRHVSALAYSLYALPHRRRARVHPAWCTAARQVVLGHLFLVLLMASHSLALWIGVRTVTLSGVET